MVDVGLGIKFCEECKGQFTPRKVNRQMYDKYLDRMCFTCAFWSAQVDRKDESIRIAGVQYTDGGWRKGNPNFNGYGGRVFRYRFLDSEEIHETNNLWHQGEVIPRFVTRLPDNAYFIDESRSM